MRARQTIHIDLSKNQLTAKEASVLAQLIKYLSSNNKVKLRKKLTYTLSDAHHSLEISLSHSIIKVKDPVNFSTESSLEYKDSFLVIEKILGRGTFGTVKLNSKQIELTDNTAQLKSAEKRVIKITRLPYHQEYSSDSGALEESDNKMFKERDITAEVYANTSLQTKREEPRILKNYFATEYFGEYNLSKYLQHINSGKIQITNQELLSICANVIEAVENLHKKNIHHRDIKPDNIIINPDTLKVWLIDFGLSDKVDNINENFETNGLIGSFAYMAPELFEQTVTITQKADLFALGMVLLDILSKGETDKKRSRFKKDNPHWERNKAYFKKYYKELVQGTLSEVISIIDVIPESKQHTASVRKIILKSIVMGLVKRPPKRRPAIAPLYLEAFRNTDSSSSLPSPDNESKTSEFDGKSSVDIHQNLQQKIDEELDLNINMQCAEMKAPIETYPGLADFQKELEKFFIIPETRDISLRNAALYLALHMPKNTEETLAVLFKPIELLRMSRINRRWKYEDPNIIHLARCSRKALNENYKNKICNKSLQDAAGKFRSVSFDFNLYVVNNLGAVIQGQHKFYSQKKSIDTGVDQLNSENENNRTHTSTTATTDKIILTDESAEVILRSLDAFIFSRKWKLGWGTGECIEYRNNNETVEKFVPSTIKKVYDLIHSDPLKKPALQKLKEISEITAKQTNNKWIKRTFFGRSESTQKRYDKLNESASIIERIAAPAA